MNRWGDYFFCGVGGSGMTPLALIVQARGGRVEGSDRALDQGRDAAKFDFLRARGVRLHPQDGSGVRRADQILVTSAAVEDTVPDVQAARRIGAAVTTRARLLAELFNASGCEVDESDGSIALFAPRVALVNNISLDHKPLDELRALFRGFVSKGETVVLNLDNAETAALVTDLKPGKVLTWSLSDTTADLLAGPPVCSPGGIAFPVKARASGQVVEVTLKVPGLHNLANALAALSATIACGVGLADAAKHLEEFSGIRRRLEVVGTANEITVIDDFAHNPDKIAATLQTMHAFAGRLLLMFQPHGYGPLRLMRDNLVDCFACGLRSEDVLLMPEPVYFGGTVDRSVGSGEFVGEIVRRGRKALALPDRSACGEKLVQLARRGDRILVMGARDDSLSQFARDLVQRVERIGKV